MFALLLKDILSLKKNLITYIVFLIIYTVIGIYTGNSVFFLTIALVFCVMMPVSALSVDEQCHWERMEVCMPVSRGAAVVSKYVLALLTLVCALMPALAVMGLRAWSSVDVPELSGQDVLIMAVLGVIMTALQMPFLIWLGVEKGRFVSMGVIFLLCFGVPVLILRSNLISYGTEYFFEHIYSEMAGGIQPGIWLLGLVTMSILALSIWISIRIYNKKEIA